MITAHKVPGQVLHVFTNNAGPPEGSLQQYTVELSMEPIFRTWMHTVSLTQIILDLTPLLSFIR